jgi:sec-independent protein translocase protein TatB
MLRAMFGMGGTEILVILIVALLFLGPDKLPDAAKKISKGIRDIKKQSRVLQQTIEDDEHIGGALRDLRSALRGEEEPLRPRKPKQPKQIEGTPDPVAPAAAALIAGSEAPAADAAVGEAPAAGADASSAAGDAPAVPGEASAATPAAGSSPSDGSVADSAFEGGHMPAHETAAPVRNGEHAAGPPKVTLPPTAGEPGEERGASTQAGHAGDANHADAELAALVKPAPNTIARGASSAAAGPASGPVSGSISSGAPTADAAEPSEPKHG